MGVTRAALAAVVAAAVFVSPAAAQPVEISAAERAFTEGRFEDARRAFDELVRTPLDDPAVLARVYLHLGMLAAIAESMDEAGRLFAAALAIDPALTAPEELPPQLLSAFYAARDEQGGERLILVAQPVETPRRGEPVVVQLGVDDAPASLVEGFRVVAAGASDFTERTRGGPRATVTVPAYLWSADGIALSIEALNDAGGVLARTRLTLEGRPDPLAVAPDDSSVVESPWFWSGIGAGVAAVVITVLVVVAVSADPELVVGAPMGP